MKQAIGRFAVRHAASILFIVVALCIAGGYAALHMPSSIFPQADFPRVVVLVNNGFLPADEMVANVTRPIEEAMKDIPGCRTVRSVTGRGQAQIDIFFTWDVDMVQSELFVNSRLATLRAGSEAIPASANVTVYRMTFAAFPIVGISLTSPTRHVSELWDAVRYTLKPQLLRIPGIANVDLVGGTPPEFHVVADPIRLAQTHLSLTELSAAIARTNVLLPVGVHEQDQSLSLAVFDSRVHTRAEIENIALSTSPGALLRVGDVAKVETAAEPAFTRVTAEGHEAVLLNIFSQPDGSTLDIVNQIKAELPNLRKQLPTDARLAFFYDQSLLVNSAIRGVWEAIAFGLVLAVVILYFFLKNWATTLVATIVIPVSVLFTILAMKLLGMSYNLMTLGGIAAAVGLVIDDAIVVVEAIHYQSASGLSKAKAVEAGIAEIFEALLGSTLTPIVVFIPLAFLQGLPGVFFRALALTMVVSLITSLLLALTLTPSLASAIIRPPTGAGDDPDDAKVGGIAMRTIIFLYERTVRLALKNKWFTIALALLVLVATGVLYQKLKSDLLPAMDEGGFVIDYIAPPGIGLAENNRQLLQVESIIGSMPEVESYSRRTGAALGYAIVEPNTGDFLIKLKPDRKRSTRDVIVDLRNRINMAVPRTQWAFPGILADLIGDLVWSDEPIEIRLFSNDMEKLKTMAAHVESKLTKIPGVVDVFSGLVYSGPSINFKLRVADVARLGLSPQTVADEVNAALYGKAASSILQNDRIISIRVKATAEAVSNIAALKNFPLRTPAGVIVQLDQIADVVTNPGELELHRDDLRQDLTVTSELEGRDLGSAMKDIQQAFKNDPALPAGSIEYGGLYEQQQEAFHKLLVVLIMAIVLVFTVALLEFRTFYAPIAIVFGAVLSLFGIVLALHLTGTTLTIISYLGAIIGMGIVHKNGILLIDYVEQLRSAGWELEEAIVYSGRRRLRPVLMTSLAAAMGMLPLAIGIGSGADMLRPLAIAVIGAVAIAVLLSLIVTPTAYYLLMEIRARFPNRQADET